MNKSIKKPVKAKKPIARRITNPRIKIERPPRKPIKGVRSKATNTAATPPPYIIMSENVNEPITPPVTVNVLTTKEQQAGVPAVVNGNSFEGVKRIDDLSFEDQLDTVFNPLHTITKTKVKDAVSESTYIVDSEEIKRNT